MASSMGVEAGQHQIQGPHLPLSRLYQRALLLKGRTDARRRMAQLVADEARRLLPDCEAVVSAIVWHLPGRFEVLAGAGPWAETLVGQTWAVEGTVHQQAFRAGEPMEVLGPADRSPFPEVFRTGHIRSGRLVPLHAGAAAAGGHPELGAFGVWSSRDGPFSDAERAQVDDLGRLATLLLVQVQAWESAERSEGRLRLRRAIAEHVQSSLDIPEVVERTVGHLLDISEADRLTLSVVEDGELRVLVAKDREGTPAWSAERWPLSHAMQNPAILEVFTSGRSVRGGPFETSHPGPYSAELARARHTALVPLLIRREVTGLIALTRRSGDPFTDDEIVELEIGASVAALALRNARLHAEVQAAAVARSAFLNLAAHELRTPFAVLSGYLALLRDGSYGPPPEAWAPVMAILNRKTAELGRLIDQILSASRAESGRLALQPEPVGLVEAVTEAVARLQPRVDLQHGEVTQQVVEDSVVRVDRGALATVLDNILNNAATYTDGSPQIEVTVDGAAAGPGGAAVVRVRDHGRGIPAAAAQRIFEQFYRVEHAGGRPTAGSGLGLWIAHRLVAEMGGKLTLEWSEPGSGSEFALRLPLEARGR
jgi:signal transduction histidine kinase